MKIFISFAIFFFLFHNAFGQMTNKDSVLNEQAKWMEFDCYQEPDYSKILFMEYSNRQNSCVIYNLAEKDSVVTYYYSGIIASIGLYYGCEVDTILTTSYTEVVKGVNIPSPLMINAAGDTILKKDYYITIDSIDYVYSTNYQISYTPVYEITFYNEEGKILENNKKNRKQKFVDFKKEQRTRYAKP